MDFPPPPPVTHSPNTLVEDEELLVGQPLALEDSDHAVMDAVGRQENGHPEARASRFPLGLPSPAFPVPSSPTPEIMGVPMHC